MTMHSALLLYHSQTAQMLESCWNWLDPGLGLIKLANPAAGTGFQGQEWRGRKLEVTRTLLGGARAWHNSDGKWFVRFREGAECVGHSCTLGRWKMKRLQRRRGSAVDPAVEQVATRDRWLPATPSFFRAERRWEKHVGWAAVQELFASCQLVQQGDLKLVWRWSQGPSCESRRRV